MPNSTGTYAIVDKEKKIAEKFREKATAIQMLSHIQKNYYEKLRIIKIK